MKQTKKLEIILLILYLIAVLVTFFVIRILFIGACVGGIMAIGDWFLLKKMSSRWVKKGRFSLLGNFTRWFIIALFIIFSYKLLSYSFFGLIIGFSILPFGILVNFLLFKKDLNKEV